MWFKNLRVYRFTKPFEHSLEQLEEQLSALPFEPCGKQDPVRSGWVPPLGRHGDALVHATKNYWMICNKRQEKVLPSAVIKEQLEERILAISQEEDRRISRSERDQLKEEIVFSLLPRALAKSSLQFAYIALKEQMLVINASSAKRAEELLASLRDALGSVPVIPLTPQTTPIQVMTRWLQESAAADPFQLGDECELEAPKDEGRVVRCSRQDLTAEEVINHLNTGMVVRKLALNWKDAISCVVDQDWAIKRIKFADTLLDQVNDRHPESAAEEFDLDFSIMTLELSAFIEDLTQAFGGVKAVEAADQPLLAEAVG